MERNELRSLGRRLVREARAIRATYPNVEGMGELPVSAVPPEPPGNEGAAFWRALGYLRAEMVLVRAGHSGTLVVLDDEIALVESLFLRP